jgi:hypothetical protein
MLRIRFNSDHDRVQGNWVLLKNTVSRRLRDDVFEIAEEDRKFLDAHQLNYTVLPVDPNAADNEIRIPITYEKQRWNGD